MREIRRRIRAVGALPGGNSAMILVAARLRQVAGSQWGQKRYMDMSHLKAVNIIEKHAARLSTLRKEPTTKQHITFLRRLYAF
ncbi:transposase-like protein [Ereboglobus sp. PH5-10]|nr:transposase-like protein [Ereboglobus sp. PH5-10]